MHAHIINYYYFHHDYSTVCALKIISVIVASIQLIIIGNSKVISVVFSNEY